MSGSTSDVRSRAVRRLRPARMLAACLTLGLSVASVLAAQAQAIYGPAAGGFGADIVSVDNASDEQGNVATTDADISADGRYVVFQTRATNFFEDDGGVVEGGVSKSDVEPSGTLREGGIFRYDRVTGAIQLVADGSETYTEGPERGALILRGAQNPSASAEGRYVAFSTAQRLVPQDTNENVDVYVRDMDVPLTAGREDSGAFTLVSAKDGGEEAASYASREQPLKGAEPGSEVWPNTSISASGRYVVFHTTELESDLPDRSSLETAPRQLFVRDLQSHTTVLLSRDSSSGEAAGGVVGPATISADGSTVSWVSTNAPAQTRFLPGESQDPSQDYYLWRRWQEFGSVTRRVTGVADPDDPACHEGEGIQPSPIASGPCYGPLTYPEAQLAPIVNTAPGLSEDGYTVAFLAGAALRPNVTKSSGLDVFLTSMRPGVTRKSGTRELTLGVPSGAPGSTQSIESLAFSSDGSTIAFNTMRDRFVLTEPVPFGSFSAQPTVSDLYVINLRANTLERAVLGDDGGELNQSVAIDPTVSADGLTVAFVSGASNLIEFDSHTQGFRDAFTARYEVPAGTAPPPTGVNSTEGDFSLISTVSPELGLKVRRAKDGGLILLVETPGPGKLTASAQGRLTIKVGRKSKKKKVVLAHVSGTARAEGTTTLTLRLAHRYSKELKRAGKLKAAITVDFTPPAPAEGLSTEASASFTRLHRP